MHHARIELCDGIIRYRVDGPFWELPLSAVRVIGEMTNDHGPFLDDYFFCFATAADRCYEASFYAEGREDFLKSLAIVLGCDLPMSLVGSTDYDSNVLWPPHLAGRPMFSFIPEQPKTWIGWLIGATGNTQCFSDEVLAELRAEGRTSSCT